MFNNQFFDAATGQSDRASQTTNAMPLVARPKPELSLRNRAPIPDGRKAPDRCPRARRAEPSGSVLVKRAGQKDQFGVRGRERKDQADARTIGHKPLSERGKITDFVPV